MPGSTYVSRAAVAALARSSRSSPRAPPPVRTTGATSRVLRHRHQCRVERFHALLAARTRAYYLIDMQGRKVHTWKTDSRPGLSQYLLPNGHLLRAGNLEQQNVFRDGQGAGGANRGARPIRHVGVASRLRERPAPPAPRHRADAQRRRALPRPGAEVGRGGPRCRAGSPSVTPSAACRNKTAIRYGDP